MSKPNKSGNAFPVLYPRADEDGRQGMSLRAWLAGMAMQALLSNHQAQVIADSAPKRSEWVAWQSCEFADALIAELDKGAHE